MKIMMMIQGLTRNQRTGMTSLKLPARKTAAKQKQSHTTFSGDQTQQKNLEEALA